MKSLYISKGLIEQGMTREEVWKLVNFFDKECILHKKYKYASLLPIKYLPKNCAITPDICLVLVLTNVDGKKVIELIYFYKDGVLCKSGKRRKFFSLYQLHIYEDGEEDVRRSLPMRLLK